MTPSGLTNEIGGLVTDRAMRALLVVVFALNLHLFGCIRERLLKASMQALSVGFPGREKSSVTPLA